MACLLMFYFHLCAVLGNINFTLSSELLALTSIVVQCSLTNFALSKELSASLHVEEVGKRCSEKLCCVGVQSCGPLIYKLCIAVSLYDIR